jgi:hypothetical protein
MHRRGPFFKAQTIHFITSRSKVIADFKLVKGSHDHGVLGVTPAPRLEETCHPSTTKGRFYSDSSAATRRTRNSRDFGIVKNGSRNSKVWGQIKRREPRIRNTWAIFAVGLAGRRLMVARRAPAVRVVAVTTTAPAGARRATNQANKKRSARIHDFSYGQQWESIPFAPDSSMCPNSQRQLTTFSTKRASRARTKHVWLATD